MRWRAVVIHPCAAPAECPCQRPAGSDARQAATCGRSPAWSGYGIKRYFFPASSSQGLQVAGRVERAKRRGNAAYRDRTGAEPGVYFHRLFRLEAWTGASAGPAVRDAINPVSAVLRPRGKFRLLITRGFAKGVTNVGWRGRKGPKNVLIGRLHRPAVRRKMLLVVLSPCAAPGRHQDQRVCHRP
jgi:hypothetical protein